MARKRDTAKEIRERKKRRRKGERGKGKGKNQSGKGKGGWWTEQPEAPLYSLGVELLPDMAKLQLVPGSLPSLRRTNDWRKVAEWNADRHGWRLKMSNIKPVGDLGAEVVHRGAMSAIPLKGPDDPTSTAMTEAHKHDSLAGWCVV